ncbi:MAG TPA: hypothetical protein VM369_00495 [Candidatus Binatia bacterium]|nr:hypothetical protein [Candidatus Binatia bacterium]
MRRAPVGELPRWQRWCVYGAGALLLVTGLLWLVFHYALAIPGPYGPQPHPLEYFWLRLHGAAAMLGLLALGSLVPMHVHRAWQQRRSRISGTVTIVASVTLILSGYLLYYFATEASRSWIAAVHWGVGLAALPVLLWHASARFRLGPGRMRGRNAPAGAAPRSAAAPPDARLH